ncbi:MAG: hypothetical protein MJE77_04150 [Proteobacteria bacterium]|nr:hypothetical protein [Pseudomonadota bacterium]
MTKLDFPVNRILPVVFSVVVALLFTPLPAAGQERAAAERAPSAAANLTWVVWGMNYTRAALGLDVAYRIPLFKKPGILWQTSNITVGFQELYSFTNNSVGGYAEITPIALFKLRVQASYDYLPVEFFDGGVRVLTEVGRDRLDRGRVERGDPDAVDWVDGIDNRDVFFEPINGQGFRLQIQPTLQGKVGPVALQYNFTADFNVYSAGDYDRGDIYYDPGTFTLRELRDRGYMHELVAVHQAAVGGGGLTVGVTGTYYSVAGTGLDSLSINGLAVYRLAWKHRSWKPWFATQIGTHLDDPMHQYDIGWMAVTGMNIDLL